MHANTYVASWINCISVTCSFVFVNKLCLFENSNKMPALEFSVERGKISQIQTHFEMNLKMYLFSHFYNMSYNRALIILMQNANNSLVFVFFYVSFFWKKIYVIMLIKKNKSKYLLISFFYILQRRHGSSQKIMFCCLWIISVFLYTPLRMRK